MNTYQKPQVVAKNLPTGTYAAGCQKNVNNKKTSNCSICAKKA